MNHLEFYPFHNRLIEFTYRGKILTGVILDCIPYSEKKRETDYVYISSEFIEIWRDASSEKK